MHSNDDDAAVRAARTTIINTLIGAYASEWRDWRALCERLTYGARAPAAELKQGDRT